MLFFRLVPVSGLGDVMLLMKGKPRTTSVACIYDAQRGFQTHLCSFEPVLAAYRIPWGLLPFQQHLLEQTTTSCWPSSTCPRLGSWPSPMAVHQ